MTDLLSLPLSTVKDGFIVCGFCSGQVIAAVLTLSVSLTFYSTDKQWFQTICCSFLKCQDFILSVVHIKLDLWVLICLDMSISFSCEKFHQVI